MSAMPEEESEMFTPNALFTVRQEWAELHAGAIDRINHCLDARGNMSLGQGVVWQQLWNQFHATINAVPPPMTGSLHEHTERLKQRLNTLGRKRCSGEDDIMISSELKKRRNIDRGANNTEITTIDRDIPGQEMLLGDLTDFLVELYFSNIHPWIPVLHIRQFRRPLHLPDEKRKINMILHTTSVCVHFSDDPRFGRCRKSLKAGGFYSSIGQNSKYRVAFA
ncbi:c6 transcription factor protein [Stemphylium lycopersici]|nr:c6 transcription factor protein [Stemphylium lycopersici]